MKKLSKMQIAALILSLVPAVAVAVLYTSLPEKVPMHWDFGGHVSYDDKWQLIIVAVMSPIMELMFLLLPHIDPRKKSYDKFQGGYELFQLVMTLFMLVIISICIIEAFKPGMVDVPMVICALCSLLFIVLGNMLPKFRQNFFFGMKNPWTLSSEKVWTQTHRLAGRMMFTGGLIGLIGAFVPNSAVKFIALFVPVMVSVIAPTIFSYIWFNKEKQS